MKKTISLLIILPVFLFKSNPVSAQSLRQIESRQVSEILTFVEDMKKADNDNMSVKLYVVGAPSDSIPNSKSEEIYNRLIISVSEKGEYPKYKVYELSKLLNVSNISLSAVDPFTERIEFIHGKYKQRMAGVLEVSVKSLNVVRIQ